MSLSRVVAHSMPGGMWTWVKHLPTSHALGAACFQSCTHVIMGAVRLVGQVLMMGISGLGSRIWGLEVQGLELQVGSRDLCRPNEAPSQAPAGTVTKAHALCAAGERDAADGQLLHRPGGPEPGRLPAGPAGDGRALAGDPQAGVKDELTSGFEGLLPGLARAAVAVARGAEDDRALARDAQSLWDVRGRPCLKGWCKFWQGLC